MLTRLTRSFYFMHQSFLHLLLPFKIQLFLFRDILVFLFFTKKIAMTSRAVMSILIPFLSNTTRPARMSVVLSVPYSTFVFCISMRGSSFDFNMHSDLSLWRPFPRILPVRRQLKAILPCASFVLGCKVFSSSIKPFWTTFLKLDGFPMWYLKFKKSLWWQYLNNKTGFQSTRNFSVAFVILSCSISMITKVVVCLWGFSIWWKSLLLILISLLISKASSTNTPSLFQCISCVSFCGSTKLNIFGTVKNWVPANYDNPWELLLLLPLQTKTKWLSRYLSLQDLLSLFEHKTWYQYPRSKRYQAVQARTVP